MLLKGKEAELRAARESATASDAHQAELATAKAALAEAQAAAEAVRLPDAPVHRSRDDSYCVCSDRSVVYSNTDSCTLACCCIDSSPLIGSQVAWELLR